jgi:hypothetical protein
MLQAARNFIFIHILVGTLCQDSLHSVFLCFVINYSLQNLSYLGEKQKHFKCGQTLQTFNNVLFFLSMRYFSFNIYLYK